MESTIDLNDTQIPIVIRPLSPRQWSLIKRARAVAWRRIPRRIKRFPAVRHARQQRRFQV